MRRTATTVAVGVVAGVAMVGGPMWAVASPDARSHEHGGHMSEMMSDPEMRQEMETRMSEMMSDPELRDEMRSMMSGPHGNMPMMGDGSWSMMDR